MVIKNLCILVLLMKVALALEGGLVGDLMCPSEPGCVVYGIWMRSGHGNVVYTQSCLWQRQKGPTFLAVSF